MEFHHVMEAAGVVILGLVFYSYALRWLRSKPRLDRRWRHVFNGLAFGALSAVLMISRIQVRDGVFIDARAVPIALIGLVEGWPAALLAALLAAGYRVSLGGAGMLAGVLGIVGTAVAASLVHRWARRAGSVSLRHALTLAGAVFAVTFASFLVLGARGLALFPPLALPFLVMSLVGIGCGAYLFRDVIESQAAEAASREAAELRAVTLLARAAAHEINNPLAIVVGGLALVARKVGSDGEAAQWIARAGEGAQRIKDIVVRMNNITQVAQTPARGYLPPMLDIRKSSEPR